MGEGFLTYPRCGVSVMQQWLNQLLFKFESYRFNICFIFFLTDHHAGFVFLPGPCVHHPAQELKKFYWNKYRHDQTPGTSPSQQAAEHKIGSSIIFQFTYLYYLNLSGTLTKIYKACQCDHKWDG